MTKSYPTLLDHLRTSLSLSIGIGSLMGLLVLISMSFFLDDPFEGYLHISFTSTVCNLS